MLRFATYNMLNMFDGHRWRDPTERERWDHVAQVIGDLGVDIIAVQELRSPDVVKLAKECGMTAYLTPMMACEDDIVGGELAVAEGVHDHRVALIWNPDTVHAVSQKPRVIAGPDLWHAMLTATFEVQGSDDSAHAVEVGSVHLRPFGQAGRADECERVAAAASSSARPVLIGGDWNLVAADRLATGEYYDPDPYAGQPWHPAMIHQCTWEYDEHGRRTRWRADRHAGDILYAGGLHDAAAALHTTRLADGQPGLPWTATTGHWPTDPHGPRRVDGVRVTNAVIPALRDHGVVATDLAIASSDHLPVVVTIDPAAIDYTLAEP